MLGAGGAEPVDQLAEGTPVSALLLALQGFVVVGAGVAGFEVLVQFYCLFLDPNQKGKLA